MLALLAVYLFVGAAAVAIVRWLRRPAPLGYALVFWLLPIVFAHPGFFAGRTILPVDHAMAVPPWSALRPVERRNPNLNDAAMQIAPWAKAVRIAWKEGSVPLRDRWNGCGTPLASNGQSAAFSPLTFLMFALPLAKAFTLASSAKLFLALFGTWLWLAELGVSRAGALFGAVSFGLSFAMTPWVLFPNTAVICLWPWALFAVELLAVERAGGRAFWALTAIFWCWAVGGPPESAALGAGFLALWLLGRMAWRDLPRPGALLGRVALSGSVALGLAAFLLLPQALAIAASNRLSFAEDFTGRLPFRLTPHGPFWPNGLVTPFLPRALGDAIDSPMIEGSAGSFPEMALAYFGIAGWAVALGVLRPGSKRRRTEMALLLPGLIGLAASIGQWPVFEAARVLPVLRLMLPLRYFAWVSLAGPAVAAFELDRLRADVSSRRTSALAHLAIPLALAAYALIEFRRLRPLHRSAGGQASQEEAITVALLCLGLVAALLLVVFLWPRQRVAAASVFCLSALTAAELLYQGMRLYGFGLPAQLYPDMPVLAFLRSRPGPFRVVGEGSVLFPNSNVFAGVEDIRTHDAVERRDYVEFLNATCGYPPGDYFKRIRDTNAPVLDFLNVRYLVSAPARASPAPKWRAVYSGADGTVFENRDALPRVFAPETVSFVRPLETAAAVTNAMIRFGAAASAVAGTSDWRRHAYVLGGAAGEARNGAADVTGYRETANTISFRARSSGAVTTLVASVVQDGGWSARDDSGRRIETSFANGPFLALHLPEGNRRILLRYRPPGFAAGCWISMVTLSGALMLAAAGRLRRSAVTPGRWGA